MMQRRHVFGFFFVFLFLAPAWSGAFASANSTPIATFSTGSAEETLTITNGQHSTIGFDLERNTTITTSSFFIKPDNSGTSPGVLSMDIDQIKRAMEILGSRMCSPLDRPTSLNSSLQISRIRAC